MKNFLMVAASCVALLALVAACAETENGNVEYVPFQETKDGQWGMISMDGKVLFTEEFKSRPTVVRDGRFFVRTKEGVWEMYEASEKPKKIGKDYAHASGFRNGVALVAEKDKPVSIINTAGETVKLLDKVEGKAVDGVRAFAGGYAVFMTADSLWGAVDEGGKCVVKPEYCALSNCSDGKFIGISAKYRKEHSQGKKEKVKVSVISTGGKAVYEFMADKYEDFGHGFVDGKLPVCVKKDGEKSCGLIDEKGEQIVKPSRKLKAIGSICGDVFTYYNGEGWGLMNIKGETLIRAKYEALYCDGEKRLLAVMKDGETYKYKYVDTEDNPISEDTYVSASLFRAFDGEHTWVKPDDKLYSLIDEDGKQVEGLPDIVEIGTYEGETYIMSDYVDIAKLVAGFDIKADGLMGFSFSSTPQAVVRKADELGMLSGTQEHPAASAYWFDYRNSVQLYKDVEGARGFVGVEFTGNLSRQTYRTKRVIDYTFGDYYWYHDDKIPTGYVWNDVKPKIFSLSINREGKMRYKLRSLYAALTKKFMTLGTVAKQNDNAMVLNLRNGRRAVVVLRKDEVAAAWGELKPVAEIDIERFKNLDDTEDDMDAYDGMAVEDADSLVADSAYVDSIW